VPDCEIRIAKTNSDDVGEICYRGPQIMDGYFREPDATDQVLRDGWYHSGDLGRIDDRGHLHVLGRCREWIVLPTGEKSTPLEVEARYQGIEAVEELVVLGVPISEHGSHAIHCAVVAAPVMDVRERVESEVRRRASQLPPRLRIEHVHFTSELPRTRLQKVRRLELLRQIQDNDLSTS
jgi:long-chain acyl-CoA synthetase